MNKYIKISNIGKIDINSIFILGASSKEDDNSKIGQFGTGLKYAISYLMRNRYNFFIFNGKDKLNFELKSLEVEGKTHEVIYLNNQSMNITTRYGYQWQAWEAFREIYCNSLDEKDSKLEIVEEIKSEENKVNVYIPLTDGFKQLMDNFKDYFIVKDSENVILETESFRIIKKNSVSKLKLYKQGVLINTDKWYNSKFDYDLKNATLNELRQYQGNCQLDLTSVILNSSNEIIKSILNEESDIYEKSLDFNYYPNLISYDKKKVKEIFAGYIYTNVKSTKSNDYVKYVENSWYDFLKDCDVTCKRINTANNYTCYGYSSNRELKFEIFNDEKLKSDIESILEKWNKSLNFEIAVFIQDEDLDCIKQKEKFIINYDLKNKSYSDLENIILVLTLNNSIYEILKRAMTTLKKLSFFHHLIQG